MNRIAFALIILQLFSACRNNSPSSSNVLRVANNGLLNSITSTKHSTETILLALQEKMADPLTAEKARFVAPKALAIDQLANDLNSRIEKIKDQLAKEQDNRTVSNNTLRQTRDLSHLLLSFRDSILLTNPYFKNQPETIPALFAEKFDQRIINGESINTLLFESISPLEAITLLSRFQLNIRELALRNAITLFESTTRRALICTFPMPLIGQSHQVLKPNGRLTLEVAMGEIRYNGLKKVRMKGKEIFQDDTGVYKDNFTAPSAAGKYKIPVIVTFTDQDGNERTVAKDINYEVMKCEASERKEQKE